MWWGGSCLGLLHVSDGYGRDYIILKEAQDETIRQQASIVIKIPRFESHLLFRLLHNVCFIGENYDVKKAARRLFRILFGSPSAIALVMFPHWSDNLIFFSFQTVSDRTLAASMPIADSRPIVSRRWSPKFEQNNEGGSENYSSTQSFQLTWRQGGYCGKADGFFSCARISRDILVKVEQWNETGKTHWERKEKQEVDQKESWLIWKKHWWFLNKSIGSRLLWCCPRKVLDFNFCFINLITFMSLTVFVNHYSRCINFAVLCLAWICFFTLIIFISNEL